MLILTQDKEKYVPRWTLARQLANSDKHFTSPLCKDAAAPKLEKYYFHIAKLPTGH